PPAALALWIGQPATRSTATPCHAAGTSFLGALGLGVSQSIWNYSGWDNQSTVGGEIEDASATYPRALARALPLVTAVYLASIVPVLALTDWTAWTDGAWPHLAATVVGPWLGRWIAAAGMVSAFALFNALLLAYSRIPLVLAQDGLLPAALAAADAAGAWRAAWPRRCAPSRPGGPAWSWPWRSRRSAPRCTWRCARAVRGSAPRPSPGSGRRAVLSAPRRDSRASLRTLGMARNIAGA